VVHKQRRKIALVPVGFLLLLTIVCIAFFAFVSQFKSNDERLPFSVAGWNAPLSDSRGLFTGTRLKMVDDLLRSYDFHGWSAKDVQKLLGEPFIERYEGEKQFLEYDLRDGLNLLVLELDGQDKVVSYHVYKDD
jgi:hypothetical protein